MSDRHERVRRALRRLNVRQEEIAAMCGVSQSLVCRTLSGEVRSTRVLRVVAALLNPRSRTR